MPDIKLNAGWLPATWPAPAHIRAGTTTRIGGISTAPYDTFNLAAHVGDHPDCVTHNRKLLCTTLGLIADPAWLKQEHGDRLINLENPPVTFLGDGSYTSCSNQICVVLTADCLPLLLCDKRGNQIAAVHVGWRGFSKNIITSAIARFACHPRDLLAWMGPSISSRHYEVGPEVRAACQKITGDPRIGFVPARSNHWYADLAALVKYQLQTRGITNIHGGDYCTFTDVSRFYSYRRDETTGRMASLIWKK